MSIEPSPSPADSRADVLLDAAILVFARYGFRKTSMDEVARAAGVSRQGLYLTFSDKEELFRRALTRKLTCQLGAASVALARADLSLEQRLVAACDEWAGRHIGMRGTDAADLMCASTALAGDTLSHYEALFEQSLADAIGASPLAGCCRSVELSAADAARALHAAARGFKQSSQSREEFVQGMTTVARLFCATLDSSPSVACSP